MKKEELIPISIKMTRDEAAALTNVAEQHGMTRSAYGRCMLTESCNNTVTSVDIMKEFLALGLEMAKMNESNMSEQLRKINERGAYICQILSSK